MCVRQEASGSCLFLGGGSAIAPAALQRDPRVPNTPFGRSVRNLFRSLADPASRHIRLPQQFLLHPPPYASLSPSSLIPRPTARSIPRQWASPLRPGPRARFGEVLRVE